MNQMMENHFLNRIDTEALIKEYGSPLYVYDEQTLRERVKELVNLLPYPWFGVSCSIKANSNLHLLRIIREEGMDGDAMSPGEMFLLEKAGFDASQIFFICNNVSADEMKYALDRGILVSVDSLSQLETLGRINPGGRVALRFNPGTGAGHHEKVVTAGSKTKFGIQESMIDEAKAIVKKYGLKVAGINQHIGSLFLDSKPYIDSVKELLRIAAQFENLEFVDFGGGFGIPYKRFQGEKRLDLKELASQLAPILLDFRKQYGGDLKFKVEPGRYPFAECCAILGTVHAIKNNYDTKYIGTDVGFNVLIRPVLYDSYHEVLAFRNGRLLDSQGGEKVTIVGNICESGDILARDRLMPPLQEGDIIGVLDAGSYGYTMSSNYNQRLRPAEVMITLDGDIRLIRRRDTLEDLLSGFNF